MAFISIKSNNPDFSHVLEKNPASGMQIKSLKKGTIFGYFNGEKNEEYCLYFRDAMDEVSFPEREIDEQFEYGNLSRYNYGSFPAQAFRQMFSGVMREVLPTDVPNVGNVVFIPMIKLKKTNIYEIFKRHFETMSSSYKFELEKLKDGEFEMKNIYSLRISTDKNLHELLTMTSLLSMLISVYNNEPLFIEKDLAIKYAKVIERINAPYFIRYIFNMFFLSKTKVLFEACQAHLESSPTDKIKMNFGDSHAMRINALTSLIPKNANLIDLGCGEGRYLKKLARIVEGTYVGIDIDEECLKKFNKVAKFTKKENIHSFPSLDDIDIVFEDRPGYILCTEVIEHMEKEEALDFLNEAIKKFEDYTLIVTTPNKNFNLNYFDNDEEMRHDDHKFEMTNQEFETWIKENFGDKFSSIEFIQIGDIVNGESITSGVVLKK